MDIESRIFSQATAGTPFNPGLPATLANLLVAQSKHETNNFTSPFLKNQHNAFGYTKYEGSPYQTGSNTPLADNNQQIADYRSIEDSVKEMTDWIYRRVKEGKFPKDLYKVVTPEQYALLLKNAGYYGDTLENYTSGLKRYFVAVLEIIDKPSGIIIVVACLILLWKYYKKRV